MAFDLNTLVNPPFAQDPPIKLNVDAKILGAVVALLSVLGILLGLGALPALLGVGAFLAPFAGFVQLIFIGVIVGLVANVMSLIGGWQMYQGKVGGKRLVVYGLAVWFLGEILSGIGFFSVGNVILPILVIAIVYYLVVISRFPGEQSLPPKTT